MPSPLIPGVHIEESPIGRNSIDAISTSATAFIGTAASGPMHEPNKVNSRMEYERIYGGLAATSEMSYALMQFFANGGNEAWVVRIPDSTTDLKIAAADLATLDAVKDPLNLLCIPGITDPASLSAAVAYCEKHRMFLIADVPKSAKLPADVAAAISNSALPKTESGAAYYPWLNISDPLNAGQPRLSAPSGAIAGLYARIDNARGVWKAPAGMEASLNEVQSLAHTLTDAEMNLLNSLGINSLRAFPEGGAVVWGARTLAGTDQNNSEYKYVPVRRLALFLEDSLYRGTKWVVFEPNDEPLWAKLRLEVNTFLLSFFRAGAFAGTKPEQVYFVKCGRDTMTQDEINQGIVNIQVGFAPLKPAEFVIIQIAQLAQPTTNNPPC